MFLAAESNNPILPPLGELIIGLIAFALVCVVLMRYVFPRMEQTFQDRRDAIEGGIERAERAQAEAQRTLERYRAQLAEARNEAAQIRDNARAEGQRIIDELRARAQAESERVIVRGQEQLAAEREQIVTELRADIGRIAVDLAERIVGQQLADDARRRDTVERFLAELDSERSGSPTAGGR